MLTTNNYNCSIAEAMYLAFKYNSKWNVKLIVSLFGLSDILLIIAHTSLVPYPYHFIAF